MSWRVHKKAPAHSDDNRINIIIAIIFLLGVSIIYRLYYLQVLKYDFYIAKANSQQKSKDILVPSRGNIFIQDRGGSNANNLYPIATNKGFASIYAVPSEVKKPVEVAELLYKYFDEADVLRNVEKIFRDLDQAELSKMLEVLGTIPEEDRGPKRDEIVAKFNMAHAEKDFVELREVKKKEEIINQKAKVIEDYLARLQKLHDPYEPIKDKVDEDTLQKLYLDLIKISDKSKLFTITKSETDKLLKEAGIEKVTIKDNPTNPAVNSLIGKFVDKLLEGVDLKSLSVKDNAANPKDKAINVECSDGATRILKIDGIGFREQVYRYYPEKNVGSHILGFVKNIDNKEVGEYGLEGFFNDELTGKAGSAEVDKGARKELIVINGMNFKPAVDGNDLILTIDRAVQYKVCNALTEAAIQHKADSASAIIMDPKTGAIIAMCGWPDYDPNNYKDVKNIAVYNNPAIFEQYEPGSVVKVYTMAAAIDQGKVTPETEYNDHGFDKFGKWTIKNSDYQKKGGHGMVDMTYVLEYSLNTGAIYAMQQTGKYVFADYLRKFGFNEKTGIELDIEVPGDLSKLNEPDIKDISAATASFGQGIMATPLQLISALGAIANKGVLMKPYIVKEIVSPDGSVTKVEPKEIRQVISEKTAALIGGMLVNVVEHGHAKGAQIPGYWVAGKTGTAQRASKTSRGYFGATNHTFMGMVPVENPAFVMLVRMDDPKDAQFAESSVVPLFGKLGNFLVDYWQLPKERKIEPKKKK